MVVVRRLLNARPIVVQFKTRDVGYIPRLKLTTSCSLVHQRNTYKDAILILSQSPLSNLNN